MRYGLIDSHLYVLRAFFIRKTFKADFTSKSAISAYSALQFSCPSVPVFSDPYCLFSKLFLALPSLFSVLQMRSILLINHFPKSTFYLWTVRENL